jgi:YggT family protein
MGAVVLSNFISAIAVVLSMLLTTYMWIVVIAALLTWVNPDPRNPIVRFLHGVTEPVFHEVRRRLPFVYTAGFDFSPLVVIAAIYFLRIAVVQSLFELAIRISLAALAGSSIG